MSDLTDFKRHEHEPLVRRNAALVAENQQLRDALTFYAERRNLHVEWSGETQIRDRGEIARAALAGTPSEDTE